MERLEKRVLGPLFDPLEVCFLELVCRLAGLYRCNLGDKVAVEKAWMSVRYFCLMKSWFGRNLTLSGICF